MCLTWGDVQEELTTKAQKAHEGEESKNQYLLLSIVRLLSLWYDAPLR